MFLASILVTIVTAVIIRYLLKFVAYWRFFNKLPGEKSFHPFYGNLHVYPGPNEEGLAFDLRQVGRYRTFHRFWAGPITPVIVCYHPDTVKVLLKSSAPKPRSNFLASVYDMGVPWLGEGLLIANGQKWSRNRRLITPSFHFEILRSYMSIYNQCTKVLLSNIKTFSDEKKAFDVFVPVSLSSLDIILQCAFSYHSNCQTMTELNVYEQALAELVVLWTNRTYSPHHYSDFVYHRTANGKRFLHLCDVVHKEAETIIKHRKDVLDKSDSAVKESKVRDFLDMLLMARDEDGQGMSMLDIRNEVDTFLFEGHDTTTSGMSWTLYLLAQHPEHQEKVYQEVLSVMDGKDEFEWNDLSKLEFTTMCIKEALRCHTAVPFIERLLEEPMVVDGHTIPAGTFVACHLWMLHHNPAVWDEPNTFDPYRFTPDNQAKMDPFQFIPFSAGSRNCIGQTFAMNEMRITVAQVIKNFRLSVDPDNPPARRVLTVTMKAEKGAMVVAVPRDIPS